MHELPTIPVFADFDDDAVYNQCERALLDRNTRNFVIQFDSRSANCALDLNKASIDELLAKEVCHLYPGSWDSWAKQLTVSRHQAIKWYEYAMDVGTDSLLFLVINNDIL